MAAPPLSLAVISGQDLVVSICPERGAEVANVTYKGRELLHRGGDFSQPAEGGWYGHGQVLWPGVGRQKDASYTWEDGCVRPMPLHGFAKDLAFTLRSCDDTTVVLELRLPGNREAFPFPCTLTITYSIVEGVLHAAHRVSNDGTSSLPFAIGNHITLAVPLGGGEGNWEGVRLRSTAITHQLGLGPGSLLDGKATPAPEFASAQGAPLTTPGCTDGVFAMLEDGEDETGRTAAASAACELTVEQHGGLRVTVGQAWTSAPARGEWTAVRAHLLFVLWGSEGAGGKGGFLCPEPWSSGPDSLNTRRGLPVLRAGEEATWTWSLSASG